MNLVAADVSPLILHWGSLSRLTSAATSQSRFMVPMHGVKTVEASHEPCSSGRESAHSSLGKFEPTHVGCYEPVQVHGPNARRQNRGGLPMNLVAADVSPLILHCKQLPATRFRICPVAGWPRKKTPPPRSRRSVNRRRRPSGSPPSHHR